MSEAPPLPPVERRKFPRRWRRGRKALIGLLILLALGGAGYAAFWRAGPPQLARISPSTAHVGQTILLEGQGFDTTLEGNVVYFGDYSGRLARAGRLRLEVEVPDVGVPAGSQRRLPVKVEVNESRVSNALELVVLPSLDPEPGTNIPEDEEEDEEEEEAPTPPPK
jgi:hypothetical protein